MRHSITHARTQPGWWTSGTRNNFQIEVGLKNGPGPLRLAVAAVVFDWGIRVQAGSFLVFGFYPLAVSVHRDRPRRRPVATMGPGGGMGLSAVMPRCWGITRVCRPGDRPVG